MTRARALPTLATALAVALLTPPILSALAQVAVTGCGCWS